ncbi:MAG: MurR/RpiR family transcriptional regulator [Erysipelotrichaceae bacterium]|nr:MurR/RpiR family transcriptional regulator [Erysipelotrichaceae bacterium]
MTLEKLVNQYYDKLNENDKYIWQYIYHHQQECQKMSIQELARICNVSHTTIIRFAKKIGLDGYSDIKMYLKWGLDKKFTFHGQTLHNVVAELKQTLHMMETHDFDNVLKYLDESYRIFIYATGEVQYHAAQELKREFVYRKKIMHVIEGRTELDTILHKADEHDVFILISLSGENSTVVTLAKVLQKMKMKTIGIGLDNQNQLSKYCNEYIGFKTSAFDISSNDKKYCCTGHFFIIVSMLFLRYLEY